MMGLESNVDIVDELETSRIRLWAVLRSANQAPQRVVQTIDLIRVLAYLELAMGPAPASGSSDQ